jgi:hypothetical protein
MRPGHCCSTLTGCPDVGRRGTAGARQRPRVDGEWLLTLTVELDPAHAGCTSSLPLPAAPSPSLPVQMTSPVKTGPLPRLLSLDDRPSPGQQQDRTGGTKRTQQATHPPAGSRRRSHPRCRLLAATNWTLITLDQKGESSSPTTRIVDRVTHDTGIATTWPRCTQSISARATPPCGQPHTAKRGTPDGSAQTHEPNI